MHPATSNAPVKLQRRPRRVVLLTVSAALFALFVVTRLLAKISLAELLQPPSAAGAGWQDYSVSVASQGKLWKPVAWRQFSDRLLHQAGSTVARKKRVGPVCDKWAVVTTIFEPTKLLLQLRNLDAWCLVVVGDKKTAETSWRDFVDVSPRTTVYLSPDDQVALRYETTPLIPWNHFGRKNVGYLYAVHHGAKLIWDTDDDNDLRSADRLQNLASVALSNQAVGLASPSHHLWNPYPYFKPVSALRGRRDEICWPRGFPLSFVKDPFSAQANVTTTVPASRIAIFQSLANNDPDVDALYRLTNRIPLSFRHDAENATVALPPGRAAPFNAQATLWASSAFFGLLLPVTVHGRVTDIWRSYFVQRLLAETPYVMAFTSPVAVQYRNAHALLADLQSEVPLYTQADELTKWLKEWKSVEKKPDMYAMYERLFVNLYEIGVLELKDVKILQAWLKDLKSFGYQMPTMMSEATRDVTVAEATRDERGRAAVILSDEGGNEDRIASWATAVGTSEAAKTLKSDLIVVTSDTSTCTRLAAKAALSCVQPSKAYGDMESGWWHMRRAQREGFFQYDWVVMVNSNATHAQNLPDVYEAGIVDGDVMYRRDDGDVLFARNDVMAEFVHLERQGATADRSASGRYSLEELNERLTERGISVARF